MTRPALRPLTAATAAVVAGAVGAVPATAAGAPAAPPVAAHWHAPPLKAVLIAQATPAAVNAATTREPGAPQTGLAVHDVVVAGSGIEAVPPRAHGSAGPAAGAPARARAPPR
jgi:hypothetical protein